MGVVPPAYRPSQERHAPQGGDTMEPDNARELKARILALLPAHPAGLPRADAGAPRMPWVAVGLAPADGGRARVAVRLEQAADRALLPDLGAAVEREIEL